MFSASGVLIPQTGSRCTGDVLRIDSTVRNEPGTRVAEPMEAWRTELQDLGSKTNFRGNDPRRCGLGQTSD